MAESAQVNSRILETLDESEKFYLIF